jgi:hypothetical protein
LSVCNALGHPSGHVSQIVHVINNSSHVFEKQHCKKKKVVFEELHDLDFNYECSLLLTRWARTERKYDNTI